MDVNELTVLTDFPEHLYDESNYGPAALLVIYGDNIGRSFFIDRDELIIGRSETADIHLDQDSVSRNHARITMLDGVVTVQDLDSTNGTYVNGRPVSASELADGDRVHVGETILKYISAFGLESEYHEKVYRLLTVDDLTQAFNRQFFLAALHREMNRVVRYHRVLSLVLCDVDNFKTINDTYGHMAGDRVLKEFVEFVTRNIRRNDMLCRFGGDEFAIVLPETNRDQALYFCDKLRKMVAEHPFRYRDKTIPVSVSLGVKHYEPADSSKTVRELIAEADKKLYDAKKTGRNRVCG